MIEVAELVAHVRAETSEFTHAMDGVESRVVSMGRSMTAVGATLSTHLSLPLVAVGALSGDVAVKFQSAMELIHTQAGLGEDAVESLSKSVLGMAGSVGTAPEELAAGLYHLASQGLRGKDALDALKSAAEGAKIGGADLEDVTNALGATLVSGIKGVENYGQVMGELNATVGAGDMRMQDLADALGTGLPAKAAIAGVGIRDVSAALATFGDNNIRGAQAGTLLNSTIRLMAAPSGVAAKALASVHISATELADKLRGPGGLPAAIADLKTKLEDSGKSASEQAQVLTHAFGGRQSGGVQILIDQLGRLNTKEKEVAEGGKSFADDWSDYTQTTAFHLASMGAQMQATGVTIGTVLLPVVAEVVDWLGRAFRAFDNLDSSTQHVIIAVAGVAAAIGPVVAIVGALVTAVGFLITPVGLLVAGIALLVGAFVAAVVWPDKLASVLEKMGLSAQQAGAVVSGLQTVFHAVETAAAALVGAVRAHWTEIKAVITEVVDDVVSIVRGFIQLGEAIWRNFGGTLTSIARTEWNYIKETIQNALEVIRGVIDVVTGIIHGDWSQVWRGIKEITGGVLSQIANMIRTGVTQFGNLAKLAGEAILKGIVEPIAKLAGELLGKLKSGVSSAIHTIAGWVVGAAAAIGKGIVEGIVGGVTSLPGELEGKLSGMVHGALDHVKGILHINSPSLVFANEVGAPIAEGIIHGFVTGSAALPSTMNQVIQHAIDTARNRVQQAQAELSTAWSSLTSQANAALQGVQGAQLTPTEALIKREQDEHNTDMLNRALDAANGQLSDAQKGENGVADPAQVAAAQQAVNDAKYAILIDGQQKIASQERFELNARQQLQQQHFDAALAHLEEHLSKVKISQAAAQKDIVSLLKRFGVDYQSAGDDLGTAFATGLHETITKTSKEAHQVGQAVINGVRAGMHSLEDVLKKDAENVAKHALAAAKKALGIKSPSQVFADEVGAQITAGISMGVLGGQADMLKSVQNAVYSLTDVKLPQLSLGAGLPSDFAATSRDAGQATQHVTQVVVPNATFLSGNRQTARQFVEEIKEFLP